MILIRNGKICITSSLNTNFYYPITWPHKTQPQPTTPAPIQNPARQACAVARGEESPGKSPYTEISFCFGCSVAVGRFFAGAYARAVLKPVLS